MAVKAATVLGEQVGARAATHSRIGAIDALRGLALLLGYQGWLATLAVPTLEPRDLLSATLLLGSYQTNPAIGFPVLGWLPLMGVGYWLGGQLRLPHWRAARTWLLVGGGLLIGWAILRLAGSYGDYGSAAGGTGATAILLMSKTPPSLSFLAFNLGLAALLMAGLCAWPRLVETGLISWLAAVGQGSLFFYVAHLAIYHLIALSLAGMGLPALPAVVVGYATWLGGLALLLPLTLWYRSVRRQHPQSVLRYL